MAAAWRIRYGRWCASYFTDAITVLCLLARYRESNILDPTKFSLERMPMTTQPDVTRSWLRFDDVTCVRCDKWAGPEGDRVYVVEGEGCVCTDCITDDEKVRAHDQR